MNLIKPEFLKEGDTIGILAPSGNVRHKEKILRAKSFLENKGYKVVFSDNIFDEHRYLAGNDEKKIQELHKFFKDPEIKAIICMRGGYGAIRLIKDLDYNLISNNPKIFCGYSDITALSLMILKKSNLMTFSGPMMQSDFGAEEVCDFTINSFFNAVKGNPLTFDIQYTGEDIKGILWGGNLATIVSLCGQDFIPDEDFIFFAEDLNEPAYKIDKMMTQLLNIDTFRKNIKAIVLGDFLDIDNENWFNEIFEEISKKYKLPIARGLKITHNSKKVTVPIGINAILTRNKLQTL